MLKKFAAWFICFGLSFLVEVLGWAEQGKAFLFIKLGFSIFCILLVIALILFTGTIYGYNVEAKVGSLLIILYIIGVVAIILLATWGATKLFDVDFYVAYQLMTFGQCLCNTTKKKDD